MSGHSKWHQIRYKKGITDARRGQLFNKAVRALTVAAREAGSDPETNYKLRLAIEKAKDLNMPKDSIEKAIKRGTGELAGVKYEQITYEGYGSGGVAFLVEVLTDNRNRVAPEIRNLFTKNGGRLSEAGSVAWMFEKKGIIRVETNDMVQETREELELTAIDAGALDIKEDKDLIEIYTKPEELHKVKQILENKGIKISSSEILAIPKQTIRIENKEEAKKIIKLATALEDSEEVVAIHSNFDIEDKLLEETTY